MALSTSNLSKIATSSASGGGTLIRDGKYLFMLSKVIGEKKYKGETFIAEFVVMRSEAVEEGVTPNAPGTLCSYVVNLDRNESAAGNVKSLVLALLGIDEGSKEVTIEAFSATVNNLCDSTQPGRGMLLADSTFRKIIRSGPNAGKPFTGHKWEHVANTAESIAAHRAMLDAQSQVAVAPAAAVPAQLAEQAPAATALTA